MNDELAEIRISNLEQRIDRLVQELAQGKQGDNVQNAQLQPFVPIPGIAGEDPKPFDIEADADGAKFVVRCVFYWGKQEVELADYALDEIPATGNATLYLTRSISEGEPVYALTTDEPVEGDEDTSYYKIYDFTDGEVSCDYRATFLFLGSEDVDLTKNVYFADERSVTQCGNESTDPTQFFKTNYFHIYGFGKFTANGYTAPIGTYHEASVLEIDPESTDASSVAFLVREGNSKEPDSNFLGYRKIKFGTGSRLSPFQYVEERRPAEEGEFGADEGASVLVSAKLVQCLFYWEGQLKQLPDFDVSGILGGGTVYLTGKQEKPSASSPNPEWTWAVATAEAQAPDGGKVLNFRLYEFAGQKVKVDYRTTFLSLEDMTQKAYYQLKTANGAAKITLDATGASPKIEIEGEDGKKITLDVGAFPSDCQANALAIRSFKYTDKDGKQQIYHGLFCSDIDLGEIKGGGSDVEIKGGTGIKVTETNTGDKVTSTISNTGVIGLVGQGASQAANGTITTKAANGSGLKVMVTRTAEPTEKEPLSNGTLEVDIDGRAEEDSFGPKELQLEGKKVATIFGTANVNIKQKKIAPGTGVTVTEANGVVTVSATGANTSGFTGTRNVLADTQYSGHYLQKRFYTETWKDGVLESSTLGNWITYHTAVEETA